MRSRFTLYPKPKEEKRPWYKEGLRFGCTECGGCCSGSSGYVWLLPEEIEAIAAALHLPIQEFTERYLHNVDGSWSLREVQKSEEDYDCIFLEGKRCSIYGVRPLQCRTFPWWPQPLADCHSWERAGQSCEGINAPEGRLVSFEEIEEQRKLAKQVLKPL